MVNLQCSPELRGFLCALYAPVCTEYGRMTLPCRRLCLQAKSDCYKLMDMFGVSWPDEMDCNRSVYYMYTPGFTSVVSVVDVYHSFVVKKVLKTF